MSSFSCHKTCTKTRSACSLILLSLPWVADVARRLRLSPVMAVAVDWELPSEGHPTIRVGGFGGGRPSLAELKKLNVPGPWDPGSENQLVTNHKTLARSSVLETAVPRRVVVGMLIVAAISGATTAVLDDDQLHIMVEDGKCVVDLKKWIGAQMGYTRFRVRLLGETFELQDDMPLTVLPSVQLVILEFFPLNWALARLLLQTCHENCLQQVEKLLKKPFDPNLEGIDCNTLPIHVAASSGHMEVVGLLLEARADIEATTSVEGLSALHCAAREGHVDVLKFLLRAGAAKDAPMLDGEGATALHIGAQNGQLEVVQVLLEANADVNKATVSGATAVIFGAEGGHLEVVQFLVEAGAASDATYCVGRFIQGPIDCAAQNGHLPVVKFLAEAGATTDQAFRFAASFGHLDIARLLLEARADVNVASKGGQTPLHSADETSAGMLLAWKAEIDTVDEDGETPLHVAARTRNLKLVKLLVEAGANKDAITNEGKTALCLAAQCRCWEMVGWLVENGAEKDALRSGAVHVEMTDAANLLYQAAEAGHVEVVLGLLVAKASPNQTTTRLAVTPLHLAAQNGHLKVVQLLLEAGANETAALTDGRTALFFAEANGHVDIVRLLLLH
eukprot:Skav228790  [mRNA]  locus=scaffold589:715744:719207:- [translate_table: standard]